MRQLDRTRRRLCIGGFVLVAAPLLVASVASACTQLTNLQANPNSGPAGATVTVTGTNYRNDATALPVEIRLDSRSGPPIATFPVASINPAGRTISLPVTIPASVTSGYHTLIATQRSTATGNPLLSGFPVRATYEVTGVATREAGATPAPVQADQPAATGTATASGPAAPPAAGSNSSTQPPAPGAATPTRAAPTAPVAAPAPADGAALGSAGRTAPAPGAAPAGPASPPAPFAGPPDLGTAASGPTAASTAAVEPRSPAASVASFTGGLLAASSSDASPLPVLALALGVLVVLAGLGASWQSGRTFLAGRRPVALA